MRIRIIILILSFFTLASISAQRKIEPTDSFKIQGEIKAEKVFTLSQLDSFPKQLLKDQIIYNHKGEIKDTIRNSKGILFKTLLESTELIYDKPKELNEFYFVFVGSDGYKVVFSWMKSIILPLATTYLSSRKSKAEKEQLSNNGFYWLRKQI